MFIPRCFFFFFFLDLNWLMDENKVHFVSDIYRPLDIDFYKIHNTSRLFVHKCVFISGCVFSELFKAFINGSNVKKESVLQDHNKDCLCDSSSQTNTAVIRLIVLFSSHLITKWLKVQVDPCGSLILWPSSVESLCRNLRRRLRQTWGCKWQTWSVFMEREWKLVNIFVFFCFPSGLWWRVNCTEWSWGKNTAEEADSLWSGATASNYCYLQYTSHHW